MKKIEKLSGFLFFISSLSLPANSFSQNVGIGTSTPHSSAALEVQSTSKGVLVPRVALTATNVASPVTSPADALLIYNSATAGTGSNAVSPGFYYWSDDAARWTAISGAAANNGNTGFGVWGDCTTNGNISDYNPVTADDGAGDDRMGISVSIFGNYAIIGAPADDIGANVDQGSAYIFYYNGSTWVQQQKVTASDGATSDFFGYHVFISGNYAIVSSLLDDIGANTDQGSAYVFFYNGSTWVQQQKLTSTDGASNDQFGTRASISGNLAIIGAGSDDVGINVDQGSSYIFFYNGSAWVQQQKLTSSDGTAGDFFGSTVSISGNYVIVGAVGDDIGPNPDQGSAYIFFYNGSTWSQQQKLATSDGAAADNFGSAVSISGNYSIVGAYFDDNGTNANQGSAYIFFYNGSTWIEQQKLTASDGASGDNFGVQVGLSGNYAIVGSYVDDIGTNTDQGSVYLFQNLNGIWQPFQKVVNPGGSSQNLFGLSCSIYNNRFVIGAFGVANNRGMAFFGKTN